MSKKLWMIAAVMICLCVIAGCANNDVPEETAGEQTETSEPTPIPLTAIPGVGDIGAKDVACIWMFDDSNPPDMPARSYVQEDGIAQQLARFSDVRLTERMDGFEPHVGGWTSYTIRRFDGQDIVFAYNDTVISIEQGYYAYEYLTEDTDTRTLWLKTEQTIYPEGIEQINYDVVNQTGDAVAVAFVPRLERAAANGWEPVECEGLFCGTPDPLEEGVVQHTVNMAEWFPTAGPGTYRLSVTAYDDNSDEVILSDVFIIEGGSDMAGQNAAASEDETFRITIYTDKEQYSVDEAIACEATLEYLGTESLTIYSSSPLLYFYINGGDFEGEWAVNDMLVTTVFEPDDIVTYDFSKSGGFSADDPNADFWAAYYAEDDLILPPGTYAISAEINGFFDADDYQNSQYIQRATVNVTVE